MSEPAKKRATYQDLIDAPENLVAELINGVLELSPRPRAPHAMAASALGEELGPPFKRGRGGPGGWIIIDEPEIHFGENVLVPDLAGWRRERMPKVVDDKAYFSLAPDWVCEVVSPSSARRDRIQKMPIYAEGNVGFMWLVDPLAQSLEIYRLENARWSLIATHAGDEKVRAAPFDAIELDLSILWADVELMPTR